MRELFKYLLWRYHRYQDHAFDQRYRVDTGQGDASYLQDVASGNKDFAVAYEPVQVFMFRRMLRELALNLSGYAFVDLGSGKGRALLLAAQHDFAQIIGVEFSPQLHEIAQTNVATFSSKLSENNIIKLLCQDAAEFEFPRRNLVLFLYNPFFGPAMQAVVEKIARFVSDEPFDLVILYRNPQCSGLLDAVPGLDLINATESFRIYRKTPAVTEKAAPE